ncbi:hypothetical protein BJV82DRAFT_664437 [Fennellomyces sp. T-0311]|nr:hypothetical protein BJV82DRAFT_664437 [Fennellomyces sp. T-0311]
MITLPSHLWYEPSAPDRMFFDPQHIQPATRYRRSHPYLLNRLPKKPPRSQAARNYWKSKWPQLCAILETLNKHCNPDRRQGYVPPDQHGRDLLEWMEPPAPVSLQPTSPVS